MGLNLSKIRAFMKFPFGSLCLIVLCLMGVADLRAEQSDHKQPINVESDALRYDDLKQISVFTGNVVVTRGSIVIRGARVEVRQDPEGYQFGVVTALPGKRAFFRQKRDGGDEEYIEGESETIEYDGKADVFRLIKTAELRRLHGTRVSDVVSGTVIVYNSLTDIFTVDGTPQSGGGRVRATLTPRSGASSAVPPSSNRPAAMPGTAAPPGAPVATRNALPLRSDDSLGSSAK